MSDLMYLLAGMQAAVAGGDVFEQFSTGSVTFTPKMSKRVAPGPFDRAPIMQGAFDGSGVPDVVSLGRGTQVDTHWYNNFDAYQGSISFWWTPEKTRDATQTNDEMLVYISSTYKVWYEHDNQTLSANIGGQTVSITSFATAASTKYHIVIRWDVDNTLDGTNYICVSKDDAHTFGATSTPTAAAPDATIYVGQDGNSNPANAIIEGLTVYRRPLFDGTNGIDAGNGDEVNLIYAAGSGKDPAQVTGSWDVVFCLPTDQDDEAIVTGTGEAWSHPHASGVLTDQFCETTYASSAWSDLGTPSTGPADQAAGDKIFNWGYKWTCDAADEGVTQGLTGLAAGQNYVLRCVAHCTSANDIHVRIQDDTNTAQIGADFAFGASSSRTAPGVALITFELPTNARNGAASDCTAISVEVVGTANTQEVFLHQIELLENLIDNPSLETGSGDPWIPDGWGNVSFGAGDTLQETTTVHSGASSLEFAAGAATNEAMRDTPAPNPSAGKYVGAGAWFYGNGSVGPTINAENGQWHEHSSLSAIANLTSTPAAWTHAPWVLRRTGGGGNSYFVKGGGAASLFLDDLYMVALDDVSLTVTPATEANSAEGGGLRIDGRDTCTQTFTKLAAQSGKIKFNWTPRHGDQFESLGEDTNPHIFRVQDSGANNHIALYFNTDVSLTLSVDDDAAATTGTWDSTGALVSGTTYAMEVEYSATQCTLKVGGTTRITVTPGGGIDFTTNGLTDMKWGHAQTSDAQVDAVYS